VRESKEALGLADGGGRGAAGEEVVAQCGEVGPTDALDPERGGVGVARRETAREGWARGDALWQTLVMAVEGCRVVGKGGQWLEKG
jgi:hypothetical protein